MAAIIKQGIYTESNEPVFYTAKELAKRWSITTQSLGCWRKEGIGPKYVRIGRRSIRYPAEAVREFESKKKNG